MPYACAIRAHLRDYEASDDAVFTIGPYTFRPSSKLLLNPEGRLRDLLARREAAANVIEGSAKPVALPAPEAQSREATPRPPQKHKSNRLMREADTAVGLRERKLSRR